MTINQSALQNNQSKPAYPNQSNAPKTIPQQSTIPKQVQNRPVVLQAQDIFRRRGDHQEDVFDEEIPEDIKLESEHSNPKEVKMTDAQFNNENQSLVLPEDELDEENIGQFIESNSQENFAEPKRFGRSADDSDRETIVESEFVPDESERAVLHAARSKKPTLQLDMRENTHDQSGAEVATQHSSRSNEKKHPHFNRPKTIDIFGRLENQNSSYNSPKVG